MGERENRMSDFSTAEEEEATDAMYSDDETTGPQHLWVLDGVYPNETLVCTECGVTLEDWRKGKRHDQ